MTGRVEQLAEGVTLYLGDVYELLKSAGHSPAKATEIVLDASRGDKYAVDWIKALTTEREEHK